MFGQGTPLEIRSWELYAPAVSRRASANAPKDDVYRGQ
jgi:hypothetical protein